MANQIKVSDSPPPRHPSTTSSSRADPSRPGTTTTRPARVGVQLHRAPRGQYVFPVTSISRSARVDQRNGLQRPELGEHPTLAPAWARGSDQDCLQQLVGSPVDSSPQPGGCGYLSDARTATRSGHATRGPGLDGPDDDSEHVLVVAGGRRWTGSADWSPPRQCGVQTCDTYSGHVRGSRWKRLTRLSSCHKEGVVQGEASNRRHVLLRGNSQLFATLHPSTGVQPILKLVAHPRIKVKPPERPPPGRRTRQRTGNPGRPGGPGSQPVRPRDWRSPEATADCFQGSLAPARAARARRRRDADDPEPLKIAPRSVPTVSSGLAPEPRKPPRHDAQPRTRGLVARRSPRSTRRAASRRLSSSAIHPRESASCLYAQPGLCEAATTTDNARIARAVPAPSASPCSSFAWRAPSSTSILHVAGVGRRARQLCFVPGSAEYSSRASSRSAVPLLVNSPTRARLRPRRLAASRRFRAGFRMRRTCRERLRNGPSTSSIRPWSERASAMFCAAIVDLVSSPILWRVARARSASVTPRPSARPGTRRRRGCSAPCDPRDRRALEDLECQHPYAPVAPTDERTQSRISRPVRAHPWSHRSASAIARWHHSIQRERRW